MTTTRTNYAEVERQFTSYAMLVRTAGMLADDEKMVLQHGSPSAGRAWRIYTTGGEHGTALAQPPEGSDYLGWTRSEAFDNLHTRCNAISGVLRALGKI